MNGTGWMCGGMVLLLMPACPGWGAPMESTMAGVIRQAVERRADQYAESVQEQATSLPDAVGEFFAAARALDFEKAEEIFGRLSESEEVHELPIFQVMLEVRGMLEQHAQWDASLLHLYGMTLLKGVETGDVYFGGTNPGRFVATAYAESPLTPEVMVLTQAALADNSYLKLLRHRHGEHMWIPAQADSNRAYQQYVEDVRAGRIPAGETITKNNGQFIVKASAGMMMINSILTKYIFDENKLTHNFYLEERSAIPWMYPYLTPHGLIMKLNGKRLRRIPEETIRADRAFWSDMIEELTSHPAFAADATARATFSKLRTAQAGLYVYRRNYAEAEHALSQAIELDDLSPEAYFRLADAYIRQRKFDEAITVISALLEKDPENRKVRRYREQLISTSTKDKRRQELEPMLAEGADMNTTIELLGIYRDLGQVAPFENLGGRLAADDGLPVEVYRQIGELSLRFRRFELSIKAYGQAVDKDPADFGTWIELAAANLGARKPNEAIDAVEQAVETGGETAQELLREDARFRAVRQSPAFQALVPEGPRIRSTEDQTPPTPHPEWPDPMREVVPAPLPGVRVPASRRSS